MYLIDLDSEQREIIVAAMEAGNIILGARLRRADPDGIISNSTILQANKLEQLKQQLAEGPLAQWKHLPDEIRDQWIMLLPAEAATWPDDLCAATYDLMLAFMLHQRQPPETPHLESPKVT